MKKSNSHVTEGEFARRYLAEVVRRDRKDPATVARYLNRDVLPCLEL